MAFLPSLKETLNIKTSAFLSKIAVFTSLIFTFSVQNVHASEFQIGSGTMSLKGGIFGLESQVDSSVQVFTNREQHANLLESNVFYNYSISTYHSGQFSNESNSLTTLGGGTVELPNTNYDWQGFDGQITLGYDVFKKGPFDYFGVGLSLGIAAPYIDNTGDSSGEPANSYPSLPSGSSQSVDFFASKTELTGYKIGPKIVFGKSLNRLASVYGEVSYATQRVDVKNDTLRIATNISGDYFSYELGMRYQPITIKKDLGFMTIEPSLYFTLAVNYAELNMDNLNVDLSGYNFNIESANMSASSTTLNLGVGYNF
ncbi:hypothetical protein [Thiomicrorhabdus sp. Milos-T2]|uniref:hypothetical protein n=1 Tax=Thiomicrorhabdus sp. Milos-T2 TaxID=90814 RepID=UPI0004948E63|nr:hypothetical protein [Thiomicrorhabdus sp. Milos-T2]